MTSGSESVHNKSIHSNISSVGTLKKQQSRRRSKSVGNLSSMVTPLPRAMKPRGVTPAAQPAPHTSRSKYRTPITVSKFTRQKAISCDRIYTITPKVNPEFPLSMLRHARAGEAVFSVSGSPIVATGWDMIWVTLWIRLLTSESSIALRSRQRTLTFQPLTEFCQSDLRAWIHAASIRISCIRSTTTHSIIWELLRPIWTFLCQASVVVSTTKHAHIFLMLSAKLN